MAGTAAFNPALPASAIVTSDLTGKELWAMTSLGYAPIKLLMSTSIYSLGLTGSFLAAFKSFTRGEISELTRLVHRRKKIAIDRLKSEADQLGAEDVVGVKTYIAEIGHGLVEFMAIGTAVKKGGGRQRRHAHLAGSGDSPRQGHLVRIEPPGAGWLSSQGHCHVRAFYLSGAPGVRPLR